MPEDITEILGYMTIEEAAKVLRISPSYAFSQARAGKIPGAFKMWGTRWLVDKKKFEAGVARSAAHA